MRSRPKAGGDKMKKKKRLSAKEEWERWAYSPKGMAQREAIFDEFEAFCKESKKGKKKK